MSIIASRRRGHSPLGSRERSTSLKCSYPAEASSVAEARGAVAEFASAAGANDAQVDAIRLVTSEAMTNAVTFAYPARPGHVHVTAWLAARELWVLISDNGCGLHAGAKSDGLGLGLALISVLSDGFSVVGCASGGTELRLRFDLERASAAA